MRAVAEPRRWSHHDDGFALVELIVAVLLLTVAIGGAIAVASSSSRSATASSIRQSQTAILASAAEKVRSDSSWTSDAPLTCASVGARSDITSWLQSRIGRELATDAIRGTKFVISATATAVDSAADDLCPIDADGIVPDYYDIEVVARPDAATLQRNPRVGSITERFQVNFSNRTSGGRLSIQACYSWPQVDERIPTGSCDDVDGGGSIILPPATAPVGTGGTPTCTSGDDCTAWTCAHPMLQAKCDSGAFGDSLFVSLQPIAASGWTYTVRGTDANTEDEPVRTGRLEDDGTTTLDAMLPGRYSVQVTPANTLIPWETHSVPASGVATVERGIRSRVVQMFRPGPRTTPLRIPIETRDVTRPPWETGGAYPIYRYLKGSAVTYSLLPVPLGRSSRTREYTAQSNSTYIEFTDLDPGLYASSLSTGWGLKDVTGSIGFFFVPPGPDEPIIRPAQDLKLEFSWCDAPARERDYVDRYGVGTVLDNPNPVTDPLGQPRTWKVTSCYSSGGGGGEGPPPPNPGGGANA